MSTMEPGTSVTVSQTESRLTGQGPNPPSPPPAATTAGKGPPAGPGATTAGKGPPAGPGNTTAGKGPPAGPGATTAGKGPPTGPGATTAGKGPPAGPGATTAGKGPPAGPGATTAGKGRPAGRGAAAASSLAPPRSSAQRKRAFQVHLQQLARDLHLTGAQLSAWDLLPVDLLVRIFQLLPLEDRARCAAVCRSWQAVGALPVLWRHFVFEFMQRTAMMSSSTSVTLTKQVFEKHRDDLRHVVLKVDSHQQSVQMACDILQQLGGCSLQSLQLVTVAGPSFALAEPKKVSAAMMEIVSNSSLKLLAVEETSADDALLAMLADKSRATLATLRVSGCPSVSASAMASTVHSCRHLCELSMDYSQLSDAFLQALGAPPRVPLKSLTVSVASPDERGGSAAAAPRWPALAPASWEALAGHAPAAASVALHFHYMREEDYEHFFHCPLPVTALRFEWLVPVGVLGRVARHCPRLRHLLVSSSGEEAIDGGLTEIAGECRQLRALELGACMVSCSTVVRVAKLCGPRLTTLVVPEELMLEDGDCNLRTTSQEVSCFLQRPWDVFFMPTWLE